MTMPATRWLRPAPANRPFALAKGITQVVFDRAGWPYFGKIKALADAAREAGLQF